MGVYGGEVGEVAGFVGKKFMSYIAAGRQLRPSKTMTGLSALTSTCKFQPPPRLWISALITAIPYVLALSAGSEGSKGWLGLGFPAHENEPRGGA